MAPVVSIDKLRRSGAQATAAWSLLEVALPGERALPFGILVTDRGTDCLSLRLRPVDELEEHISLEEQDREVLGLLGEDLLLKAGEMGGARLLGWLEDTLSDFLRISDRAEVAYTGSLQRVTDRLYDEYVDSTVRRFITHLPLYSVRAAATKFGEGAEVSEEGWLRAPSDMRLTPEMFVARVVGRSMEPLISDNSLCVFRCGVTGSRQGRRLLIEKFDETDFAARYTVKRYTSIKRHDENPHSGDDAWEHERVRLEPLNREFEAFDLHPDGFRVVAEFVGVLED